MSAAVDHLSAVRALRADLWSRGYRPVPVRTREKRPSGLGWQDAARANPPAAARLPVTPNAVSTGILCDGLRALDIDVEDHDRAADIEAMARDLLGATMIRERSDSAKRLLLYRAAAGEPKKVILNGEHGKIEILGHGQQFVAWGIHPDGQPYAWRDETPLSVARNDLPAVTEDEITAFLQVCRDIIGAREEITENPISERALATVPARIGITDTGHREAAVVARAMEEEISRVASAGKGTRNDTLNAAAFNLGQLVGAGWISRGEVEASLSSAAASCGLAHREAMLTIRSGIDAGAAQPRPPLVDREGYQRGDILDPSPLLRGALATVDHDTDEAFEDDDDDDDTEDAAPLDEDLTRVPGLLGELIEAIVRTARRPNRRLALAAALPILGTVIGRRVATPTMSSTALYVIATAPTAVGKQHLIDATERFMSAAQLGRHVGPSQFMSMSALNKHVEGAPLSICPQDEFGAVLKRLSHPRASGHEVAISGVMRSIWGASFGIIRTPAYATARSVELVAPCMSLMAATTPEEFYSGLKGADMMNGFMNRFLILDAGARASEREPLEGLRAAADRLAPAIARAYRIGMPRRGNLAQHPDKNSDPDPTPFVVPWATQAAHDDYLALSEECLRRIDADPDSGALFGRTAEIAIRLATIRACGEDHDAPMISTDHIAWAARLALQSADLASRAASRYMVDPLGAAEFERKIISRLAAAPGRRMKMRELHRAMSKNQRFTGDLEKTLKSLQGVGIVGMHRVAVPGGTSIVVSLE